MCTGTSKVPIDDYNSNKNTDGIHYKCEEEILGDKGEDQRGGWENLRYEKEEHNQWEENGDTECDFLPRLGWQVEHEHAQETDKHRRQN